MKSKKGGLMQRRRNALQRLEAKYAEFRAAKVDKKIETRKRDSIRTYEAECARMLNEMTTLKSRIH